MNPTKSPTFRSTVLILSLALFAPQWTSAQDQPKVDFSRDIKPLLSDRCFQCHGPDEQQVQADLRLDVRDWATEYAIVPGDPDASPLIERLETEDHDLRMPPEHANKQTITADEIAKLRQWIKDGAEYSPHWSYQSLDVDEQKLGVATSPVNNDKSLNNELIQWIDDRVAYRANEIDLQLADQADPRTLIRRLSFDLTGLPPSPELVKRFESDPSEEQYRSIVEELLASPAYGERMAVSWLDQVRYADTNGIHGDNHRDHDLFRDYVIRAFETNMPFDQFTIEQIAGDLLTEPTNWQLIASGYNRLNMTTREGGAQPKEYIAKYAADRVRNVSSVWLGSTIGCSECHNHKYDPFTQKDFYQLAAFFADVDEIAVGQQQPIRMATPEQEAQSQELAAKQKQLNEQIDTQFATARDEFAEWIETKRTAMKNADKQWQVATPSSSRSSGNAAFVVLEDGSIRVEGENPANDDYEVVISGPQTGITAIRLDAMVDPSFPNKGLSRANGNFVLTGFQLELNGSPVEIKEAKADFEQDGFPIKNAIDQDPKSGWAVSGHTVQANRTAVFILQAPIDLKETDHLTIRMLHQSQHAKHQIGRFRLLTSSQANPELPAESWPTELRTAVLSDGLFADEVNKDAKSLGLLKTKFISESATFESLRNIKQNLEQQRDALAATYRPILVTKRRDPLMVRVLPRGNWLDDSGAAVMPNVPECLPELEPSDQRANRLDLANWLVAPENPLVSRVFVNRLWKVAFGEGLVRSPDDFGSQGFVPTHPEILDRLAVEFIESGWDIKRMMRTIVLTKAYRMSSQADPVERKKDPTNLALSHQNAFRLDAEFVRDNALATSGLLVSEVGGPSVRPYQPAGYWEHLNFPKRTYQSDQGENQYRRGLYTYWCRTFLHPSLLAFDAPSREECTVQRSRSNTPLQALVLLNDPTYVEAARALAERIPSSIGNDKDKFAWLYEQVLQRDVRENEVAVLQKLLDKHRTEYQTNPSSANDLLGVGNKEVDQAKDPAELASWTNVCRVILNLHETITRY